jgi:small subunit ribosomal protein S21
MVRIDVLPGESLDNAIRRLKRQVQNAGILQEARTHERYQKPSDERRQRIAQYKRNAKKKTRTAAE